MTDQQLEYLIEQYADTILRLSYSYLKRIKENTENTKKVFPMSKYTGVAACLCILSGTAYATGILQPVSEIFAPIFGGSVAQTEIIEQIGRPLNASDTDKGVTITAEAIIGDKNNV